MHSQTHYLQDVGLRPTSRGRRRDASGALAACHEGGQHVLRHPHFTRRMGHRAELRELPGTAKHAAQFADGRVAPNACPACNAERCQHRVRHGSKPHRANSVGQDGAEAQGSQNSRRHPSAGCRRSSTVRRVWRPRALVWILSDPRHGGSRGIRIPLQWVPSPHLKSKTRWPSHPHHRPGSSKSTRFHRSRLAPFAPPLEA
jgi:hypothetical protein